MPSHTARRPPIRAPHPGAGRETHCKILPSVCGLPPDVPYGKGGFEVSGGVTVLFLSFLGTFPIGYVSYCISMCLECILMCILMCPVHIHQDTSRYTKIHHDTFVSISLAIMEMYLTLG